MVPTMNWTQRSIQVSDVEAPTWDKQNDAWLEGPRAEMLEFFYQFVPQGVKVLDLGCGPGESTRLMKEKGYLAIGVDQSPKMIEAAQSRGVDSYITDCNPLPFEDNEFDAIFVCTALEWSEEPHKIVKEMVRVLKPSGYVVAVTLGPLTRPRWSAYQRLYGQPVIHNMMMPWEMQKLLEEHGLTCNDMKGASSDEVNAVESLKNNWRFQAALSFLWAFGMIKE
jgi:ubiquinone/menaquinone biosynthesis C-methylase UbiE